jgi:RNA polymerase sigma-70 factor (ECF subfamily)
MNGRRAPGKVHEREAATAGASRLSTGSFPCVVAAWQAHEGELRGYLRRRLRDVDAADDVLQDVFLKAIRHAGRFCAVEDRRAWLFRVARNALVDRQRTAHPHEPLSAELADSLADEPDLPDPVDALSGCLARTLAELAADDASILRACDLGGQTQRAFAEAHGLSLPAAKTRLLRARRRLRERLTCACQVSFEPDGRIAGHVPRPPAAEPLPEG